MVALEGADQSLHVLTPRLLGKDELGTMHSWTRRGQLLCRCPSTAKSQRSSGRSSLAHRCCCRPAL
eukprot:6965400-Alexandrium_andersonii.AAC.1